MTSKYGKNKMKMYELHKDSNIFFNMDTNEPTRKIKIKTPSLYDVIHAIDRVMFNVIYDDDDPYISSKICNKCLARGEEALSYKDPYPHLGGNDCKRVIGKALEYHLEHHPFFQRDGDGCNYDFSVLGYRVEVKTRFMDASIIPLGRIENEKDAHIIVIIDVDVEGYIYGYDICIMSYVMSVVSGRSKNSSIQIRNDKLFLYRGCGYKSSWR